MTMVMTIFLNSSFSAEVDHKSTMVDHGGPTGFTLEIDITD